MSRRLLFALVGALALYSPLGLSQEVWIGRPTVGDYVRRDVQQLLTAYVELQKASVDKVYLSEDLAKARKAFFATAREPESREAAAKEFERLLRKKDLYYFQLYVTYGTDSPGIERVQMIDRLSRGAVDGGIFPEAFDAYLAWVNAFRKSLGFSGNGAFGAFSSQAFVSGDQAALRKAFEENEPLYAGYAKARDRAESDRFTNARALHQDRQASRQRIAGARAPDGSWKLDNEASVPLQMAHHIRGDLLVKMPPEWNAALRTLARNRTPVLECHYGPVGMGDSGTPQFETHQFWHGNVPPGLSDFLPLNNGALGFAKHDHLDLDLALAACPRTNAEALAVASAKGPGVAPHAAVPGGDSTTRPRVPPSPAMQPERNTAPAVRPDAGSIQSARIAEQQAHQTAARARQCAAMRSNIDRTRESATAIPPQHAARRLAQVARMEQAYGQQCGG